MKWEYLVTDVDEDDDLCGVMNDLGREGWEIFHVVEFVGVGDGQCTIYSKRKIPEEPTEPRKATTGEILEHIHGI